MDLSLEKGVVSTTSSSPRSRDFRTWNRVQWVLIFVLWISYMWIWKNDQDRRGTTVLRNTCEQPSPAALPSNLSSFTDTPEFSLEAAKRLAGAVKIPTMFVRSMLSLPQIASHVILGHSTTWVLLTKIPVGSHSLICMRTSEQPSLWCSYCYFVSGGLSTDGETIWQTFNAQPHCSWRLLSCIHLAGIRREPETSNAYWSS